MMAFSATAQASAAKMEDALRPLLVQATMCAPSVMKQTKPVFRRTQSNAMTAAYILMMTIATGWEVARAHRSAKLPAWIAHIGLTPFPRDTMSEVIVGQIAMHHLLAVVIWA